MLAGLSYLLAATWMRWGDLFIDTPKEFWLPEQLISGRLLYRDVVYFYGFLAPYLQAFFYLVFGVSVYALVWMGIMVTGLAAMAVYRVSRLFLDGWPSVLAVLSFLFVFAFGYYRVPAAIFNFIVPYTYASTLFAVSIYWSLYFFIRHAYNGRPGNLCAWAVCLTLAFWCRPEMSLAVWLGFVGVGRLNKRPWSWLVLPLLLGLAGYLVFLAAGRAGTGFYESVLLTIKTLGSPQNIFTRNNAGFNAYGLKLTFISLFFQAAVFGLFGLAAVYLGRPQALGIARPVFMAAVFIAAAAGLCFYFPRGCLGQYRLVSFIAPLGVWFYARRFILAKDPKRDFGLLSLHAVSLSLILRIPFNVLPYGLGFFLAVPGLICYCLLFLETIPQALSRRWPRAGGFFKTLAAAFIVLAGVFQWRVSLDMYRLKNVSVATPRGSFYARRDDQTFCFLRALEYLEKTAPAGSSLVTIPEGAGLNFFSGRPNPLRRFAFLPNDLEALGDAALTKEFAAARVDYIVVAGIPTGELGPRAFGIDYGRTLYSWIEEHYSLDAQFGPRPFSTSGFGLAVFKRRP